MATNVVYRLATPEDYELIAKFLREHFYPHEPLKVFPNPDNTFKDTGLLSHILHEPATSIVALCDDEIVGVRIAAPKGPDEEQHLLEEAAKVPGTNMAKLLVFLAVLERSANVFKKYNVDRVVHGNAICVHKDYCGKGIGSKLYELSIERAKELGYQLYTCDAMSSYAAKACAKFNMDCVNVCRYVDYRDPETNDQVFLPSEEHTDTKTFAKRL